MHVDGKPFSTYIWTALGQQRVELMNHIARCEAVINELKSGGRYLPFTVCSTLLRALPRIEARDTNSQCPTAYVSKTISLKPRRLLATNQAPPVKH
jgi:hypothetical protein